MQYSDHVQCHVEPTKRHKIRRAAGEELIVMHDCTNATGALSTVKKNKGTFFSARNSSASQPRIRLTNLFCTATPLDSEEGTEGGMPRRANPGAYLSNVLAAISHYAACDNRTPSKFLTVRTAATYAPRPVVTDRPGPSGPTAGKTEGTS